MDNDLETLDAMFWPSELTVRLSPGESLYGIEMIRAFRRNGPPEPDAGAHRRRLARGQRTRLLFLMNRISSGANLFR